MDYTIATGRRKRSVARVYLTPGNGNININDKDYKDYFQVDTYQAVVEGPFRVTETEGQFDAKINVHGGGNTGQAEAVRHALARALVKIDEEHKHELKINGFITRDPRMVERKKAGQPKARKKFQFRKR